MREIRRRFDFFLNNGFFFFFFINSIWFEMFFQIITSVIMILKYDFVGFYFLIYVVC